MQSVIQIKGWVSCPLGTVEKRREWVSGVEGVGDRGIDFGMPSMERSRDSKASLDTWRRAEREKTSQTWNLFPGGGGG